MPPVTPRAINDTRPPRWPLAYSVSSTFSTLCRNTSRCAMVVFFSPVSRGSAPASSWRVRLPAMTTNSYRLSFGGGCIASFRPSVAVFSGPEVRPSRSTCRTVVFQCGFQYPRSAPDLRVERPNDSLGDQAHRFQPGPFRQHNRSQPVHGRLQGVVDHDVLVLLEFADFLARLVEAPANLLLGVLAAAAQPLLEDRGSWRQDENADRLDAARAHLPGALHVDDENDVLPARENVLGIRRAGSVEVAERIGPLQECRLADHHLEAFAAHKIIVNAVLLAAPGRSRGVGPRQPAARHELHQALDERGFSGAGRRRHDEQQ